MVGWLPAVLISGIWILASGDMYSGYNTFKLTVLGVSLFPILAWPLFLVLGYAYVIPFIRIEPWYRRWLAISLIWCLSLIFFEWVGYHVLGIHLDHGRTYKGWPILDIFHSPVWMQLTYFGNGILYYGVGCWLDRGTVADYARAELAL